MTERDTTVQAGLTAEQFDEIDAAITAYQQHPPIGFACCSAHPAADAATALIAEIRRLHEPTEPSRYLEDGSTHTVQSLTDAGESCVQQQCTAAREEARLRQEQYTLRTEVENVLDEVDHMADDERLTADAAGELRRLLRSALGLDRPLT